MSRMETRVTAKGGTPRNLIVIFILMVTLVAVSLVRGMVTAIAVIIPTRASIKSH
jgi:hypothetical protein